MLVFNSILTSISDKIGGFVVGYGFIICPILKFSCLIGISFFLALCLDFAEIFMLKLKIIYIIINRLFLELLAWLTVLKNIATGSLKNAQENRMEEQYYPPYLRAMAVSCLTVLILLLLPTAIFWAWALILLLAAYSCKVKPKSYSFLLIFFRSFWLRFCWHLSTTSLQGL